MPLVLETSRRNIISSLESSLPSRIGDAFETKAILLPRLIFIGLSVRLFSPVLRKIGYGAVHVLLKDIL